MANGLWCGCVNDAITRKAINQARVTVTDPATGDLLGLFQDREATKPIGNPFLTRETGKIKFYVRAGRIDIDVFKNGNSARFENEIVADDWGATCSCGSGEPLLISQASDDSTTSISPTLIAGQTLIVFGYTNQETPADLILYFSYDVDVPTPIIQQRFNAESGRYFFFAVWPKSYGGYDGTQTLSLRADLNGSPYGLVSMAHVHHFIVDGLREPSDFECLLDNFYIDIGAGEFDTGTLTANCNNSFGVFYIASPDFGMTSVSNVEGFDVIDSGNPAYGTAAAIGDTSKRATVTVGSGPIYGAMLILRASIAAPPQYIATKTIVAGTDGTYTGFAGGPGYEINYGSISPDALLFDDIAPDNGAFIDELDSDESGTYLDIGGTASNIYGISYSFADVISLSISDGATIVTWENSDALSPWTFPLYNFSVGATYTITLELKQRTS